MKLAILNRLIRTTFLLTILFNFFLQAQDGSIIYKSFQLDEIIPIDPEIDVGTLENGLRYYIKTNKKPENRAELRLAVNVGSILEDDDQQGLAHFTEHMAFNGTERFAKNEIVDYLEFIGMRFGPEINAYTGFDETVYMLEVTTDSLPVMETAFDILEDWASQISFESEEIDKERGVVIEEWRLGRGAEARMLDKQLPVLFKNSRYAERLPIGKKDIIETFEHETIRRFYKDWYRPDLMAVVAVGDFDPRWIKEQIHLHFGRIPKRENVRTRVEYPVPDTKGTLFTIATDPEATKTMVSVYFKRPLLPEKTVGDYRRMLMENLYDAMLNQRIYEIINQPDPPMIMGYAGFGSYVRSKNVYFITARVKEDGIERGLEALLIEAERVRQFGVNASELGRGKIDLLRGMESAYNERDKSNSTRYASEYIRNFFTDEPIPGIAYEYALSNKLIPTISLEEMNELAAKTITQDNRVVLVDAPEKDGVVIPTEDDLLAIFQRVEKMRMESYQDDVADEPLVANIPEPGSVMHESKFDTLGVTEWILSNGVKVVLKPTDFKNDEILFSAFSYGGTSLMPDSLYIPASTASLIIREGGLGNFDKIQLNKKLTGKIAIASPYISELHEGLSGSASPVDIETLFQLIYLYFTSPRKDSTAYTTFLDRIEGVIENRDARPESAFQDTFQVTITQHHPRSRPWSEKLIHEMDLEASFRFYQDRFADASDFTFVFVGNFVIDEIKPFVETYLGGLPSLQRKETWQDVGIEPPKGVIEKIVKRGVEPKSLVRIAFTGVCDWSREGSYLLGSMGSMLRIRLREIVREDLSGTYGVSVSGSMSRYPREDYKIIISFGCDPDRVDELTQTIFAQIDTFQQQGPGLDLIQKIRKTQLQQYEKSLKENTFWLNTLYRSYYYESDLLNILNYPQFVNQLSVEKIKDTAQKYFDRENYIQVVLIPEDKKEGK